MYGQPTRCCGLVLSALLSLALVAPRTTQAQTLGFKGPGYRGADSFPSGSKAESKLWWNDHSWWACLWSEDAQAFEIHRLVTNGPTWVDTGVAVDTRARAHSDCLWDGTKLYIATHQYTAGAGDPGQALQIRRYSYDPNAKGYSLDVGFPTLIGDSSTEVLVIDKDSRGTLWAVWTSAKRVWFTHTLGDDRAWSIPAVHPRNTADLSGDDIAAVVRFQGDKLGLMWSNQITGAFQFTFHRDGDPDTLWSTVETVAAGPGLADDHISLRASRDGRVFAALKTGLNEILVAQRSAAGAWSTVLAAAAADAWTRPLLLLDEDVRVLHLFGTSPAVLGSIYEKTSSMDAPGFATGKGQPVLRDTGGPAFNDVTGTKQSVDGRSGLMVLASQEVQREYGFHFDALSGAFATGAKVVYAADPRQGSGPLTVQFIDASTGPPAQWAWNFGDGSTSTLQHPRHTFGQPGRYSISLQVTNALGSSSLTTADMIVVDPQPSTLTLVPVADGQVRESRPGSSYGSLDSMRVRQDPTSDYHAYLRFFVPPLVPEISGAELRLRCLDGSTDGGSLHVVDPLWDEPSLTWSQAPRIAGAPVGQLGNVAAGSTVAVDLGALVTASGAVSLGIQNSTTDSAYYSTRQGTQPPELQLTLSPRPPGRPEARFEQTRTLGDGPLVVQFFDASGGVVTSWLWSFGDGSTSTLQNPSHVFRERKSYDVSLRVANASGSDTLAKSDLVWVFKGSRTVGRPARTTTATRQLPVVAGGSGDPRARHFSISHQLAGLLPARCAALAAGAGPEHAPGHGPENGPESGFDFELAGSLEDALDSLEERLSEARIEICTRSLADPGTAEPVLTLELSGPDWAGTLVLRARSPESVVASLNLQPE